MLSRDDFDYLSSVGVVRLQSAARRAGLSFKNGALDKAGILTRLDSHSMIGGAAIAILKREDREGFQPTPKTPPRVDDWMDDDAPITPPATPAPSAPVDLAPLWAAIERRVETETFARLGSRVDATETGLGVVGKALATLSARVTELEASKPIEIHLPDKPPHRIEGATHRQFPDLLAWLSTVKRVILTGPAGTGKSRAASQCAEALGLPFYLQTPFTQSYEYLGHRDAQGAFHETPTFKAYTSGGVLLMDESDSSSPDAFLAANPILDGNGFAMFGDGVLHKQHPDFYVIMNMNTQGDGASLAYSGRNPLDGATIARFGGMLHWGIDPQLEASMAQGEGMFYKAVLSIRDLMQSRSILSVNATPRHTLIGAALLKNPHFASRREFILESTLKNGPVADVWADVLRLPAVRDFLQG